MESGPASGTCRESPPPPVEPRVAVGPGADGWPRASRLERLVQAALALGCWATVGLALALQPSPEGLGTHQQLGFGPCMFYQLTGRPCPGCGMTTAFAHMAHGHIVQALLVQPFGALLFVLVVLSGVGLTASAMNGRSLTPLSYWPSVPFVLYGLIALWLAAWAFKIVYGQVAGHYSP